MKLFNDVKDIMVGAGNVVGYATEKFQSPQDFRAQVEQFISNKK
jgi:hypothetical protein